MGRSALHHVRLGNVAVATAEVTSPLLGVCVQVVGGVWKSEVACGSRR